MDIIPFDDSIGSHTSKSTLEDGVQDAKDGGLMSDGTFEEAEPRSDQPMQGIPCDRLFTENL